MQAQTNSQNLNIREFLQDKHEEKIPALPLDFEYFPVEILSKEFTKLNSTHSYRIHYLGPRPLNTLILHKKYSRGDEIDERGRFQSDLRGKLHFKHYKMNLKKIINCNFTNERLQQNSHYKSAIFYRAFEGMNPTLPAQNQLIFNSAFQSGNLDCVIKVKPNEFDLFLRIDSNTRGHTSWYYFGVKNGSKMDKITLNICNLTKGNLLYDQGLRPFIFSTRQWQQNHQGWDQGGQNCKFEQANLRYELVYEEASIAKTYRLSFEYSFQFQNDEVYFAYCVPYTYSQLQKDVEQYKSSSFVKAQTLGKSLTGVDIPILYITNHLSNQTKKKNVVITARVHPGQTNSSHMLKGFIQFLLADSKEAEQMRAITNFIIVPMLNPDGVILGNTRTGVSGKDLNRQFMTNKKELYPEVLQIKTFTAKLHKKFGVFSYIDFHGHSRRKNTFLYGPNYQISHSDYYKCRILPRLIQKYDPRFRFYSCSFTISQQKKTTARAVTLNQLKIPYSYTIQSSIGLFYNPILMKTEAFNQQSWQQMGSSIAVGVFNFISAYMQHQNMLRERKNHRNVKKEQYDQRQQRVTSKHTNKIKQDEVQIYTKSKKTSLLQMFQQVKAASDQLKKYDEDVESDDQDDKQQLQGYKLNEFNNMVTKGIQRQKNHHKAQKKQQQINFQSMVFPSRQQLFEMDEIPEPKILSHQTSPKKMFQTIRYPKTQDSLRKQKLSTPIVSTSDSKFLEVDSKKLPFTQHKSKISEKKDKSTKNFVLKNKQRYSIATKNLFPAEDKCEILALPKSIQAMRRSMKKGRLLINNLQQSRLRFFSLGIKQQKHQLMGKRQSKIPFLQTQKFRAAMKSSTGVIKLAAQDINLNDFKIRKSQSHFNQNDVYTTLNGLQVDNRAMTITTFKQFK